MDKHWRDLDGEEVQGLTRPEVRNMRIIVSAGLVLFWVGFLLVVRACTEPSRDANAALKLMRTCYDDLAFHAQPLSCEDASNAYRALDVAKVSASMRVDLRLTQAAVAERMQ